MAEKNLQKLFVDELKDLYDAENRLVKAIPKMAEAAQSMELRSGFELHLQQTKGHVQRLEEVLTSIGEKASGKKCKGMQGIVDEGEEIIDEKYEGAVGDAGLISAAQRVEHYEIAAYGSVIAFAKTLGHQSAVTLLEQTLQEEKQTDQKLTELSRTINAQASRHGSGAAKVRVIGA